MKTEFVKVRIDEYRCPACGRNDRWEQIVADDSDPDHNATIRVACDCGQGELQIVLE